MTTKDVARSVSATESKIGSAGSWKTAARVYAVMVAPLCLMLIFGGWAALENWRADKHAVFVADLVEKSTEASALAHELQKERGLSAGFVGSKGAQFSDAVEKQRRLTDGKIAEVSGHLRQMPEGATSRMRERAQSIDAALAGLAAMRASVDSFQTTPAKLAKFYSALIVDLLSIADDPLHDRVAGSVAERTTSYQALLMAKEFAGRERAAGAVGFGSGTFSLETYAWFTGLKDKEVYLLNRAAEFAAEDEKALIQAARESEAAKRLHELRTIATESVESGDTQGIDGPTWFKASTAWLGELKAVEGKLAESFIASANATSVAAHDRFLVIVGVLAVSVLLVGGWGFATLRAMISSMRGVAGAIGRIEAGAADVAVPGQERRDEIGVIARALSEIAGTGAEAARVRAAVSGSNTATLILDTENRKVFSNQAFDALNRTRGATLAELSEGADFSRLCAAYKMTAVEGASGVEADVERDGVVLRCRASEVRDADGNLIGKAFELIDLTSRRQTERRVAEVIEAVSQGDLSKRIEVQDAASFEGVAATGMNRICDIVGGVIESFDRSFSALAAGDLSARAEVGFGGRYDALAGNANQAIGQIANVAREVQAAETSLREEITAMRSAAVMLSERVEAQAASLQETSSTMEEMSRNVAQNAQNAVEATQSSSEAGARTVNGRKVVSQAVGAMERIEGASGQIAEIVSVIDGIAFQTNLLALNAAVEAARAGEAGKGFAIVAAEVRTLSQRVGDAARDVKDLIDKTVVSVSEGSEMVREADASLEQINSAIADAAGRIAEISSAGREQSLGVGEISQAVAALDNATQQNAVVAETIAQASQRIEVQSDSLAGLIAFFSNLGEPAERPVNEAA